MDLVVIYYTVREFIDIGWDDFSWFTASFIELMGIMYFFEKAFGIIIEGHLVYISLITMFVFFYNFGKYKKRKGIYDKSVYVGADIDPVIKEILEASRLIIEHYKIKTKE